MHFGTSPFKHLPVTHQPPFQKLCKVCICLRSSNYAC